MKPMRLIAQTLFAVLVLALAGGCTSVKTVSVQPTILPAGQLLPHHVALVLDQQLAGYKNHYSRGSDTFIDALGTPLQDYARAVATKSFQQVEVVPSVEKAASLTSADLILIPRAVKSGISIPVWAWGNDNLTLVVEWTAKDHATQNTVWLTTITANSAEPMGTVFSANKNQRILYQKAFDDLSLKTYNAFQEAPELHGSPDPKPASKQ
jgi:hypothetical protein